MLLEKFDIYVFGSRARGTHRTDSDWDILLVPKEPINGSEDISVLRLGSSCFEDQYGMEWPVPKCPLRLELEALLPEGAETQIFIQWGSEPHQSVGLVWNDYQQYFIEWLHQSFVSDERWCLKPLDEVINAA